MITTFALLALAVLALWWGGDARAPALRREAWLIFLAASLVAALVSGVMRPVGLPWVAAIAVTTFALGQRQLTGGRRYLAVVVFVAVATGLALHRLPGFNNPRVIDAVRFSADAIPYSLYLNYDKALAGLFVLGWCHSRLATGRDWRSMLATAAPWSAGLIGLIMLLSLAAGYVRLEPKFPAETWLWLGVNLGLTCMAEEALFRGFVQAQLQRAWQHFAAGRWLALGVAALLFGLAHAAGGATYVALATVAGLGYGWVYQRTGRIEASILTHFTLNTAHFFLFTYPALQR